MPEIPRIVLSPVPYVPVLSLRFALRSVFCLVLAAFDVGVIAFAVPLLCPVIACCPLQVFAVSLLFAALLGSLARVWFVVLRSHRR